MDYGEALAYFKSMKQTDKIIALFNNQVLIEALLAWKAIPIRFKSSGLQFDGLSDQELWERLWENIEFPMDRWAVISGLKPQLADNIFERLKGYHLIFPDGSVDVMATQYVNSIIIEKLGLKSSEPRVPSGQHSSKKGRQTSSDKK
ncbi:MAG: hypothetical protein M0P12_00370 [Paludibacteraceae bacterium]|nr:hypothetical protein [Paludibacteraceae bacterium]